MAYHVWIFLPQDSNEGSCVRPSISDIGVLVRCQIEVLQSLKDDVLGKVCLICKRLVCGEEAHVLGRQVRHREAGAVVPVLQDDAEAIGRLTQLRDDPLLEKGKAALAGRLAGLEHDDGPAWLIMACIEPVSEIEEAIRVRLIDGVIVEVVDWDRDVVLWVQRGGVNVPGAHRVAA